MSDRPQDTSWFDHANQTLTDAATTARVAAGAAHGGANAPTSWPQTDAAAAPARSAPAQGVEPAGGALDGDEGLFDEDWTPPRRANRFTVVLLAGIVAAAGFAGGALVQRNHDSGLTGAAGTGQSRGAGQFGAGQFGAGGFGGAFPSGGFGGQQGSGQAGSGQAGSGQGSGGQSGSASDVPVLVGTVDAVTATTVTVKNLGGVSVVVRVSDTTTVTARGLAGLKVGATVAVFGTKAADGSVTATSVVSRGGTR